MYFSYPILCNVVNIEEPFFEAHQKEISPFFSISLIENYFHICKLFFMAESLFLFTNSNFLTKGKSLLCCWNITCHVKLKIEFQHFFYSIQNLYKKAVLKFLHHIFDRSYFNWYCALYLNLGSLKFIVSNFWKHNH